MAKKLPDSFDPAGRNVSLYEDIEYKAYWDDSSQFRQDRLEKYIIRDMLPLSGHRIIDIGCGYGRLYPCYADRFTEVILFDGSLSLLRQAQEASQGRALCVAGDVNHLPFKKSSFDCLLVIRVLQHVHELNRAFTEMRRILASRGALVFSYHNKHNAHRILHWLLLRKIASPFSLESSEVSPTLLSHHPAVIHHYLSKMGFSSPFYLGAAVINSFARITEKVSRRAPSGSRYARFLGKHELAPWLIGRALAQGEEDAQFDGSMSDVFQCPVCFGELTRRDKDLACLACNRIYPVLDGIIDMRP